MRSDTVIATLLFLASLVLAITVRWTAARRYRRR
jgi:hypothetical protein